MKKYQLVKFIDQNFELDVRADAEKNTVWLTQKELSLLFGVTTDNIGLHIKNIFKDKELDISVSEESSVTASDGKTYKTKLYNLDMIISIGYRVKSKRGITFRKWANKVLQEYLIKGYSVNQKRMETLYKTIDMQNRMLATSLDIDKESLINVINEYTNALDLLDSYDHQTLTKPKGNKTIYKLEAK